MEPKKRVVIRLKKPPEPPKVKKVSKKFQELLDQGLRYYRFVQDIAMMDKWCKYVIATGIRPNERLRQLVEQDVKVFDDGALVKSVDVAHVQEWHQNHEHQTSGEYTMNY